MNIKNILKKLLFKVSYIDHIIDRVQYPDIKKSYAGGSLATSNLLIVANKTVDEQMVQEFFSIEQVNYQVFYTSKLITNEDIFKSSYSLVGPFTHIINFFYVENNGRIFKDDFLYNNNDSFYKLYRCLQVEVDYLVRLNQYATISTCFIYDNTIDGCIQKRHADMCIRGLAEVLSNHNIICNGIVASEGIPFDILLKSSLFMSSKYGQIMSGEVLDLN